MKRVHSLMQLGRTASVESADEAAVITQPTEGQPTVQPTDEVLAQQAADADAAQAAADQVPADGSVPAEDVQGVSQESGQSTVEVAPVATETKPENDGKPSDADGSQPATPSDEPGDAAARADIGHTQQPAAPAADPNNPAPAVSTEDQSTVETAPVSTETNPADDKKPSEADGSQPATTTDEPGDADKRADQPVAAGKPAELAPELEQRDPAQSGNPTFKETAPQSENVAADPNNPSVEQLSPDEVAQVAAVAAAAGAAAAKGTEGTPAEAPAETTDPVEPAESTDPVDPEASTSEVAASEGEPATVADAAQQAADAVASEPDADAQPGENAGDAAATPAEAAQVVADLIGDNPDNAAQVAAAIDKVADAAVMADGGKDAIEENVDAGADAAQQAKDKADAGADAVQEESDDLDELDELDDEVNVAQESMFSARSLLASLEDIVEAALQNGGLSDDAAKILQEVTNHVTDEVETDSVDLGLESIAYTDRIVATEYAKSRLHAAMEAIDAELTISSEGLLDIFRSFGSKTTNWVVESKEAISHARQAITDRSKKVEITANLGESNGVKAASNNTFKLLSGIVGGYNNNLISAGETLARAIEDLNDGDVKYETANRTVGNVNIPVPDGFSKDVRGAKATPVMLGGGQVLLSLRAHRSDADLVKVKDVTTVTASATEVLDMLNDAEKYLNAVSGYVGGLKVNDANISESKRVQSKTATLASMTGFYGLLFSADLRRAWYRAFTRDEQKGKLGELKAAFSATKESIAAGRLAISEVLAIAKHFR